ncbi:response regulator transcription factor [Streptomyces sp. NBC_01306]|uniref:response regulator transcription factor n=1 Tax=Streptomyces sp. NBC_01306 TaxID=2903819 RepID=UPI002257DDB6|nr:helix-turn-helix transcriptional regulator [Streptomyces sp. NBC_01306]MCX4722308.1 helix-turn-helix transcriptional regulator [Streptomyces sp. NBC_01306]
MVPHRAGRAAPRPTSSCAPFTACTPGTLAPPSPDGFSEHAPAGRPVSPDEQRRQRRLEALSARERDVLVLLSRSLSTAEIAADAGTADGTVKGDVTNIPAELDAATRVRAATIPYRAGLDRDAEQP